MSQHPVLFAEDGSPLGQTDDALSVDSPAFKRRLELLVEAIVKNEPDVAADVFFPKVAYEQVKDIKKPGADWKHRLWKAFARNIGEYHRKLGDNPSRCTLAGLDVDPKRVKVMARGKEGNKLPYHRVTRNKLRLRCGDEAEKTLELTSLIAWRGEWFVVHLNGFK